MVKVFTATAQTQGHRANDFHHCIDGELVWIGPPCGPNESDPDGHCGCGRAFSGLNSHQATTTAIITELADYTIADVTDAVRGALESQGLDVSFAGDIARDLLELADEIPVGTVVERRLDDLHTRPPQ